MWRSKQGQRKVRSPAPVAEPELQLAERAELESEQPSAPSELQDDKEEMLPTFTG